MCFFFTPAKKDPIWKDPICSNESSLMTPKKSWGKRKAWTWAFHCFVTMMEGLPKPLVPISNWKSKVGNVHVKVKYVRNFWKTFNPSGRGINDINDVVSLGGLVLVGDFLLCTMVNHHQTTIWDNMFLFFQACQSTIKSRMMSSLKIQLCSGKGLHRSNPIQRMGLETFPPIQSRVVVWILRIHPPPAIE